MLSTEERAQLREDIEATLPDTCRITRAGAGERVFNNATGKWDEPPRTVLYDGLPCRAAAWQGQSNVVQAGEQPVSLRGYNLTLPVSVDDLAVDDSVEILTSEDSYLVGKFLRIEDPKGSSLGVQRRVSTEMNLG
jgi:hypothetical protein